MASAYPGAVSAFQVGSYFAGQYYQVLQKQPHVVHQFFADESTMIHVDGDESTSASSLLEISNLAVTSMFSSFEIKTINSLESWNGGILVVVSGSVKTKNFGLRRKFVETFFLAPQEKGYFVLNDIFQFLDEENVCQQHPTAIPSENMYGQHHTTSLPSEDTLETQLNAPTSLWCHQVMGGGCLLFYESISDYILEEEAREYVSSLHIEDPVDKYSLPDQQQQQDFEDETVVEETPVEETTQFQGGVNAVPDAPAFDLEEPAEEPTRKTYASILRVAKGPVSSPVPTQPSNKSATTTSEWDPIPPPPTQQPESGLSFSSESGFEAAEEGYGLDDGEPKSVYVRNLPSDVTAAEIEEEFQNFGRIKSDGVFVRNRKDVFGVCYAFVEFEDLGSVQNAIKASPVQLAGRQVYIEERRPNTSAASRGGRGRGRGRSIYPTDAPRGRFGARGSGRGSNQDGGDYNRSRGNGFYQRGSR